MLRNGGHIESQAIDAVHLVRLGGDLHHQILHTVIGRLAHHAEGVHRFGCGQIGFDVGVAVKAIIDRGEQCGLAAGDGVDKRLREVRGGRLALGAGDADDRELVLRISVERGGQQAHRLTCVVDDQPGVAVAAEYSVSATYAARPLRRCRSDIRP